MKEKTLDFWNSFFIYIHLGLPTFDHLSYETAKNDWVRRMKFYMLIY